MQESTHVYVTYMYVSIHASIHTYGNRQSYKNTRTKPTCKPCTVPMPTGMCRSCYYTDLASKRGTVKGTQWNHSTSKNGETHTHTHIELHFVSTSTHVCVYKHILTALNNLNLGAKWYACLLFQVYTGPTPLEVHLQASIHLPLKGNGASWFLAQVGSNNSWHSKLSTQQK